MKKELQNRILELKEKRNAVILAHNYQIGEIQDIADFVGDSFALSQQAANTDKDVIVFCGVHFMAEGAYILSPQKTVILPELSAGCPMADMVDAEALRAEKKKYPNAAVVCYVNSTAEVKAECDICCTSSSAIKIVNSLPQEEILFVPDKNLSHWVAQHTDKKIIPWQGWCNTHHQVTPSEVDLIRMKKPGAPLLVHPESRPEVVAMADFVGSTAAILDYARKSDAPEIIVGTEIGILHRLKIDSPEKEFHMLSPRLVCPNMKKTTLQKVADALENMENKITVPEDIRLKAKLTLDRMLAVG